MDNHKASLTRALEQLFRSQRLAVLATHHAGQPYTSLVSFASTADLDSLLFATTRSTRKYANLTADPRAALLVDNRSNEETDIHSAMAVTATGAVEEVPKKERSEALAVYLEKHPYLEDFVQSPTCALMHLKVRVYYIVRRFQHVVELHMPL